MWAYGLITIFSAYIVTQCLKYCLLQMSPDENPVLDHHPNHHNIIIGAGFSGTYICIMFSPHTIIL